MSLFLDDFVTPETLEHYFEERRLNYQERAVSFLREQFGPAARLLDDEQVGEVVKLAYSHARDRGIKTERDHLKYLIPVMFWGSYFESDPLYRQYMVKAWWIDTEGKETASTYVGAITEQVDVWLKDVAEDISQPKRIMKAFSELYSSEPPKKMSSAFLSYHMENIWPERYKKMSANMRLQFMNKAYGTAHQNNFTGVDGVGYACLAMYFGHQLWDDPRYPWAAKALADNGRSAEERRLALGNSVFEYWNKLVEIEE